MSNLKEVLAHLEQKTPQFKIPMLSDEKKAVWVRPLKTKDQKFAIIARDEGEDNELLNLENIINLVDDLIVKNDVALGSWTIQDFIYFLIQFRIKSLGELIEIQSPCQCGSTETFMLDLIKDAKIEKPKPVKGDVVTVSDQMKLMLGHLTVDDMHNVMLAPKSEKDIVSLASILKNVEFEGQLVDDLEVKDKVAIISELTREHAEKIMAFPNDNDYGISVEKKWQCKACQRENDMKFNGFEILNFF